MSDGGTRVGVARVGTANGDVWLAAARGGGGTRSTRCASACVRQRGHVREPGTHLESWNEVPSFTMNGWSRPSRIRFSESMCSTCCKRITSAFFSCLIAQTVPAD